MRFIIGAMSVLSSAVGVSQGAIVGTADLTPTPLGSGSYRYAGAIHNTGTTKIAVFWMAWVPGEDFLPTMPVNVVSPAGWGATITNLGAADGYGIEWTASAGSELPAGGGLTGFRFDTTDSPAVLMGNSPPHPLSPTLTSFFYVSAPLFSAGYQFVATVVPAPPAVGVLCLAAGGVLRRRR